MAPGLWPLANGGRLRMALWQLQGPWARGLVGHGSCILGEATGHGPLAMGHKPVAMGHGRGRSWSTIGREPWNMDWQSELDGLAGRAMLCQMPARRRGMWAISTPWTIGRVPAEPTSQSWIHRSSNGAIGRRSGRFCDLWATATTWLALGGVTMAQQPREQAPRLRLPDSNDIENGRCSTMAASCKEQGPPLAERGRLAKLGHRQPDRSSPPRGRLFYLQPY